MTQRKSHHHMWLTRKPEDLDGDEEEEVILRTPSEVPVTRTDIRELMNEWEEKFHMITEGLRAVEMNTHEVHSMDRLHLSVCRQLGGLAHAVLPQHNIHVRMDSKEALARFMDTYDPARRAPGDSTRGDRDRDLNERPTSDSGIGIRGDTQLTMNSSSGLNNTATRNTLSPRVPIFDGMVSAHFRPWLIQFEAMARHQCWTSGEKVVRLVASLTGPAANMLIGMTMGQLDEYAFLAARLSRRYDPPEQEEAHRAELPARIRRRNESVDELAENLKNIAQRAYPNADQNMLDNLVVERFREGNKNIEIKKHLCLYPSTGLQDLIGACVRFEIHVELGTHTDKPNEGMYTVKGNDPT